MDFVFGDPNADVAVADLMLDICYDAIFDGLPEMRLRAYQGWEWDQQTHEIVSLRAFYDKFETVLEIFRDNNFAEEYAGRWPAEAAEFAPHYEAPLARHNTAAICEYLRGLR